MSSEEVVEKKVSFEVRRPLEEGLDEWFDMERSSRWW